MTFPETPLPIRVDLQIDGAWTDVSDDVYSRDPISITRGRTAEGATVDPGRCSLTLDNRSLKYTPRNPVSPLYGKIGRNTPIRVGVAIGTPYLSCSGGNSVTIGSSTPDTAALDIVGDLDVRFEATLDNWFAPGSIELCGKGAQATNQRSWLLMMRDQQIRLEWSANGTSTVGANSTAPLPAPSSGHLAIRVTLDVNNGASGNTTTFYTAPTIAGPWVQLGTPVVAAGITSIFNSTAPLMAGQGWSDLGFASASGKIHRAEVRNGINGTVVADPDFGVQTPGTASFTDTAGRPWTIGTGSSITNLQTRFVGEVSSWPLQWDTSGRDIYVTIEAAGIMRRLTQGATALDSTLRRSIPGAPNLVAYWPMEEGSDATRAYSPIPGVPPLAMSHVTWAGADTLPSSGPLPVLASDNGDLPRMSGPVPAPVGMPTGWLVQWIYRLDTPNTTLYTFLRISCTGGTVAEWYLQTRDNESRIYGIDGEGNTIVDEHVATSLDLFGQWTSNRFSVSQSGGTVTWEIIWQDVGGDAGSFSDTYSGTIGRVRGVGGPPDGYAAALDGMAIGHIAVFSTPTTTAYDGAITAYAGETAGTRMLRLAGEEDVPLTVSQTPAQQERLGPQLPSPFLALVQEAADSDAGILYENRTAVALAYRGRETLYNQDPVTLVYGTNLMPGLAPVDDDQLTENDVTVTRVNGSSGRATLNTGPLSVNPPPAGVGTYASSVSLSLYADEQAAPQAQWLVHLGTVDEARYPVVNVNLARNPELIDRIAGLDSGDRLQILDPPAKLPPGTVDLLMQGYTETLSQYQWDWTGNCTPGSPWTVGVRDDPALGRYGSAGSQLSVGVTASATSLSVTRTDGTRWIDSTTYPTHFPFDISVGGERMTVTAITGTGTAQTFTVTRHVNGIIKAQTAGTAISLFQPTVYAL